MLKKKYVLKNKKRFFSFLFLPLVVVFTLIYTTSVSGYKESQYQYVTVHAGDTLWSIAEKYCNKGDIRDSIHHIQKINGMDSSMLYEETAILVPISD